MTLTLSLPTLIPNHGWRQKTTLSAITINL